MCNTPDPYGVRSTPAPPQPPTHAARHAAAGRCRPRPWPDPAPPRGPSGGPLRLARSRPRASSVCAPPPPSRLQPPRASSRHADARGRRGRHVRRRRRRRRGRAGAAASAPGGSRRRKHLTSPRAPVQHTRAHGEAAGRRAGRRSKSPPMIADCAPSRRQPCRRRPARRRRRSVASMSIDTCHGAAGSVKRASPREHAVTRLRARAGGARSIEHAGRGRMSTHAPCAAMR